MSSHPNRRGNCLSWVYSMLEDESISNLIAWSATADSFIMSPSSDFSKVLAYVGCLEFRRGYSHVTEHTLNTPTFRPSYDN